MTTENSTASGIILIADHPSVWRETIADAITEDGMLAYVTEDGRVLAEALARGGPNPRIVIVGSELSNMGALDAIQRARDSKRPPNTSQSILLVTDVRADVDWLDTMRRQGVSGFLYRDDPVAVTLNRLRSTGFRDRRSATRYPTSARAEIVVGGRSVSGTLDNVSETGAQVTIRRRRVESVIAQGDRVEIWFSIGHHRVESVAEVRQLGLRRSLLGDQLIVGLTFAEVVSRTQQLISAAVRHAILRLAVAGKLDGDEEVVV